jgi:hypothetical protein
MRTYYHPLKEEDASQHGENPREVKEKLAQHWCHPGLLPAVTETAARLGLSIDQHRPAAFDSTYNVMPLSSAQGTLSSATLRHGCVTFGTFHVKEK